MNFGPKYRIRHRFGVIESFGWYVLIKKLSGWGDPGWTRRESRAMGNNNA